MVFLQVRGKQTLSVVLLSLLALLSTNAVFAQASEQATAAEPLLLLGARATEGAAAGYVEDSICGTCHAPIHQSYQHVGMARSFSDPAHASRIESYGEVYYHAPSQRYYRIDREGESLTFRRYQLDARGEKINELVVPVSWVLGSGNRARNYLYQSEWGELFLLPLGWYAEAGWGMSPGYETADHPGVARQVQRECLFCHNAFPEVPAGSDTRWAVETFPHDLPEGTGCQRCHGPGADHIRAALTGQSIENIHAAIVNPVKLPADRRDSVCFQCHMLPHVTVVGARRFDRSDYSFRPGELLSDYLVPVDAQDQGVAPEDRFEINHHGYRLYQSRCYRESEGELSCISCHNPHEKPESASFRVAAGEKCQQCHQQPESLHAATTEFSAEGCVDCHMPTRRTSDVVLVTMTDHRIATGPFERAELIAPREKVIHPISSMQLLDFADPPTGDEATAYRAVAAMRANRSVQDAINAMTAVLQRQQYSEATPYLDLARAQLSSGDFAAAETTARALATRDNRLAMAYSMLGLAVLAQGRPQEAIRELKRAVRKQADPETHFNLALAYLAIGDSDAAQTQLDAAVALRPFMAVAWKYRGQLLAADGELAAARDALLRALELAPDDSSVYQALVRLLLALGEEDQAERFLDVGLRVAAQPEQLQDLRRTVDQPASD